MIVIKRAFPRRTFLRGVGATLGLPLLDSMVPALSALAATPAKPARRLGFIYMANGVAMNSAMNFWRPRGEGTALELSPILSPFEPFKSRTTVVSGLAHSQAEALGDGNGDHTRGTATWLNGVHPVNTEAADVRAGTTADQIAAREIGSDTPLPSLELGIDPNFMVGSCENGYSCLYMNTLAWRTPTTPLPMENNPRVVFERLFGDGGSPAERIGQMRRTRSILDSVIAEASDLQRTLGAADRTKVSDYFEALREVERRIQRTDVRASAGAATVLDRPIGIPDLFGDHVWVMFDLQALAYQTDMTRVFTFMMGSEVNSRTFPEIGITEPHHGVSTITTTAKQLEKMASINTFQIELVASFLAKLRTPPDGDGTLLDHSMRGVWRRSRQSEHAFARRPADCSWRRRRTPGGEPPPPVHRRHADDESARLAPRQGRRPRRGGYSTGALPQLSGLERSVPCV